MEDENNFYLHKGSGRFLPYCKPCYIKRSGSRPFEERRERQLKIRYNHSQASYQELLERQKGVCAICQRAEIGKHLTIDHNHKTNQVRGLLCSSCNLGLGKFKDDVTLLERAYLYLRDNQE